MKKILHNQYLFIGLGGMIGASSRYSLSILLENHAKEFPYSTLLVNLIGCFLLTFILNNSIIKNKIPAKFFNAISAGIIGSFTTFSTITVEIVELWEHRALLALMYTSISVIGGLVCCFMGFILARRIGGEKL